MLPVMFNPLWLTFLQPLFVRNKTSSLKLSPFGTGHDGRVTMGFWVLPRSARAWCSIATVSRPSVHLSACDTDVPWLYKLG